MIEFDQLTRRYGDFVAVDQVSSKIGQGEIVGLLGHNGAGKTTIMKMLTGYLEPTEGRIRVDNLDIDSDISTIQSRIGYLPENCPLWPEMTVIEYLEYRASLQRMPSKDRWQKIADSIRRTKLKEKATQCIETLSRGYRQRVGVAQAILHNPDIVILDEPTNGLDPTQILQMRGLIRELADSATVLISTHILQEVQAVCERVLIMRDGKLAVDTRLDDLQNQKQVLITVDKDLKNDLRALDVVEQVEVLKRQEMNGDTQYTYKIGAAAEKAPVIARTVQEAGANLYSMTIEHRNLESLFSEVDTIGREENHA